MKIILFLFFLALFMGCSRENIQTLQSLSQTTNLSNQNDANTFHTDISHFQSTLRNVKNEEARNRLMDEILSASDMECSAYVYGALQKVDEQNEDAYTKMFRLVGKYIGLDIAKDAVEAVSDLSNPNERANVEKYNQALKPNIIKAIELARKKYKKEIIAKHKLPLSRYDSEQFLSDLTQYDKRCSTYYGLLEITKALEKAQDADTPPKTDAIDVHEVSRKIKEVTWQVKPALLQENNQTCIVDLNDTRGE